MDRHWSVSIGTLDAGNTFVHAAVRAVAAQAPLPAPPAGTSWIERAGQHGVLSVLAAHLEPFADPELRSVRQLRAAHHLRTLADLALLQGMLGEAGIDWLVFKGPVLSEIVYQRPGTRNYGDLDVLVRPRDLGVAIGRLVAAGCTVPGDTDWEAARDAGRGELSMFLPNGAQLDLHWDVINNARVRPCFSVSTDGLMSASREVRLGGLRVRTFGEVDTVLHVAFHGAKSGGDRLRWLLDLQQSLLRCSAPGTEVLGRARELGLELVLRAMTNRMARFVVHRPLVALPPPSVAERSWLAADALAMTLCPPGARWQGRFSAAALAGSTRSRAGVSWAALGSAALGSAALRRTSSPTAGRGEAMGAARPSGVL